MNTSSTTTSICIYTPSSSACVDIDGKWTGKDIILHHQFNHFQLMVLNVATGFQPIDELKKWANNNNIHVQALSIQSTGSIATILHDYTSNKGQIQVGLQTTYESALRNKYNNSLKGIMSTLTSKEKQSRYKALFQLIEEGKEKVRIARMSGKNINVTTLLFEEDFVLLDVEQEYYENEIMSFIQQEISDTNI